MSDFNTLKQILLCGSLAMFTVVEVWAPTRRADQFPWQGRITNLLFSLLNFGLLWLLLSLGLFQAFLWLEKSQWGLLNWSPLPSYLNGLIALLLFDCWQYCWHRMNHRVEMLWRFHQVHHADEEMNATTALRFHFMEILYSTFARIVVLFILGIPLDMVLLYECLMLPIIIFHHSNIKLPGKWDQRLNLCIVTPDMHRIHHSQKRTEMDSNYASVLSIWDKLFGSFTPPKNFQFKELKLGLSYWPKGSWQNFLSALCFPFSYQK